MVSEFLPSSEGRAREAAKLRVRGTEAFSRAVEGPGRAKDWSNLAS